MVSHCGRCRTPGASHLGTKPKSHKTQDLKRLFKLILLTNFVTAVKLKSHSTDLGTEAQRVQVAPPGCLSLAVPARMPPSLPQVSIPFSGSSISLSGICQGGPSSQILLPTCPCQVSFSWGDANKSLFPHIPDWAPMTDKRNCSTEVQLGELVS